MKVIHSVHGCTIRQCFYIVIQEDLLQLRPEQFQLAYFVVAMVAPDWCALAVGLQVEMRPTSDSVVESCTKLFQVYLKTRNPTWKHILEVMESEAMGRQMTASFIKSVLPGACSNICDHYETVCLIQKLLILSRLTWMKPSKVIYAMCCYMFEVSLLVGQYPLLDMFVILAKLYIIPARPVINGNHICTIMFNISH